MSVALATTYHDSKDRMYDQIALVLPTVTRAFAGIAVQASRAAPARSLRLLADAGALIGRDDLDQPGGAAGLGRSRRAAVALALQHNTPCILYFDFDSISIEGTEFETGDRYSPEVMAAGGYEQWMERLNADPRRWSHQLQLARMHVEAMIPYAEPDTRLDPR